MSYSDIRQRNTVPTICHVLFSMEIGGAELLAKDIADAGSGMFRFVFACLDSVGRLGTDLQEAGYTVERIGRKPGVDLGCAIRLRTFCKSNNVDIIHAHQCGPFRHASLSRVLGAGPPIVLTEHGRPLSDVRHWRRVVANRLLLRKADRVVAVGNCLRLPLERQEGFPADRIDVIYNGRDLSVYHNSAALRAAARGKLQCGEDERVIMQVARLSREKDHDTAILALKRLVEHLPVRLIIIGEGPQGPEIAKRVDELGLNRQVTMLGARQDVSELLPAADVFLLTSISEAIPLTLIEAMAVALPCVASRVGGIPEVVEEGSTGLLAEPGDDAEFSRLLNSLLVDPLRRARMGRAARQRAEALFDRTRMQEQYVRLYEDMFQHCGN